jgi:UDP-2,3-diacylglucosamine pyrophosphatase LpxH
LCSFVEVRFTSSEVHTEANRLIGDVKTSTILTKEVKSSLALSNGWDTGPMKREDVDTLIVSDVHLGSELCNAELFCRVLSGFRFKRLVLNGDIFDHLNLEFEVKTRHLREGKQPRVKKHRLKKSHLKALSLISGLSKPENNCEVIWIEGNHDEGISHIFSSLIGATVHNEYMWEFAGKKCLAIHGDQFDEFYRDHINLVEWVTWVYQALQSFGPKTTPLCLYLKNNSKHYTRAINIVAEGAARYAEKKGADVIFCGHTHHAEHKRIGEIEYYNSGTMQCAIVSCITLGEQGFRIHVFQEDDGFAKPINVVP